MCRQARGAPSDRDRRLSREQDDRRDQKADGDGRADDRPGKAPGSLGPPSGVNVHERRHECRDGNPAFGAQGLADLRRESALADPARTRKQPDTGVAALPRPLQQDGRFGFSAG